MPSIPSSKYNYDCVLCKKHFKSQKPELASEDLVCRKCKTATNPCTTEGCRNKAMKPTGGKCRKCTDTQHSCIFRTCPHGTRVEDGMCRYCGAKPFDVPQAILTDLLDQDFSDDAFEALWDEYSKANNGRKVMLVSCLRTSAARAVAALKRLKMTDRYGWNLDRTVQNADVQRKVSCLVTDPEALPDWCEKADSTFKEDFLKTEVTVRSPEV